MRWRTRFSQELPRKLYLRLYAVPPAKQAWVPQRRLRLPPMTSNRPKSPLCAVGLRCLETSKTSPGPAKYSISLGNPMSETTISPTYFLAFSKPCFGLMESNRQISFNCSSQDFTGVCVYACRNINSDATRVNRINVIDKFRK